MSFLATETFQRTGSFKFRAAFNVAANVPHPHVITASSGNFGQAMAYACKLFGKRCTIVMPANSARVKVDAVLSYGGRVDLVDTDEGEAGGARGAARRGASGRVHRERLRRPVRHRRELISRRRAGDAGHAAGCGHRTHRRRGAYRRTGSGGAACPAPWQVVGAEPLMANDAARSLRAGHIVYNDVEPQTIADGTRTLSVGQHNWAILKDGIHSIVEVPEDAIREGVRLLFSLANLKAEPTGALGVGALLTAPESFRDRRVCCVVTGGNVDPAVYAAIIGPSATG